WRRQPVVARDGVLGAVTVLLDPPQPSTAAPAAGRGRSSLSGRAVRNGVCDPALAGPRGRDDPLPRRVARGAGDRQARPSRRPDRADRRLVRETPPTQRVVAGPTLG